MSVPPSGPDPSGETGRVRCAYCGANNFPTSAACWQCGRPLQPLRAGASAPPPAIAAPGTPSQAAWPAAPPGSRPFAGVSPGLAPKAAAALGLLFPWAGLPIGIAFLMLDDPRKAQLGWTAIGWSIAGTVLNFLLFVLPLATVWPVVKSLLSHPPGGGPPGGGIPGLPPTGGEEILVPTLFSMLFQGALCFIHQQTW
ncbi:MAG: hypothetical protein JO250_14525 [Armatimonadetes bacterium]|nr:hypothetical protein [Armatimonadota bacterium]